MNFSDSNLDQALKNSPLEVLMNAPFGIVRMDSKGIINLYNTYEAKLAGLEISEVIGKNFFTEVAPCTNNFMVAHKYLENESIDETLDYMFTYKLSPTKVILRILREMGQPHGYVLVEIKEA